MSGNADGSSSGGSNPPRDGEVGGADAPGSTPDGTAPQCAIESDGGICNNIVPAGPTITSTCLSGEPPQPQGGIIEDGIYVLQSVAEYGACQSRGEPAIAQTWSICGDHWDVGQVPLADSGIPRTFVNYTAVVSGSTVTFTPQCPAGQGMAGLMRGYTASGSTLVLITTYAGSGGMVVTVGTHTKM
jgi:hypothetical protein